MIFFLIIIWKCSHYEKDPYLVNDEGELKANDNTPTAQVSDNEWVPFRIFFDSETLDDGILDDPKRCHNTSQVFNIDGNDVRCTEAHLATKERKLKIKVMCDNVARYLNKAFKVKKTLYLRPTSSKLSPKNNTLRNDIDFYMSIYLRPRAHFSSTVASAIGHFIDSANSKRTFYGSISINPIALDKYGESDYDSESRTLFEVFLHETIHALFFNPLLYSRFESQYPNDNTKTVECNAYPEINMTKIFTIITNEHLKKWATERWGADSFGRCPMGIEVEDDGGEGTVGSHTEARLYPKDLMNGVAQSGSRAIISDVLFTMAESTGWYKANFSYAETLMFGTKLTNKNVPIKSFPVGIPRKDWPDNYQCKYDKDRNFIYSCSLNRHATPVCGRAFNIYCPGKEYCNNLNWIDPDNTGYAGSDIYQDHILVPDDDMSCLTDPKDVSYYNTKFGAAFNNNSMCFHSTLSVDGDYARLTNHYCYTVTCTKSYKMFVTVGGYMKQCTYEGELLYFNETKWKIGFINCSEPISSCLLKEKMFPELIVDDLRTSEASLTHEVSKMTKTKVVSPSSGAENTYNQAEEQSKSKRAKIVGTTVGVVVVVLVISVAVFFIIKIFKSRRLDEESDNMMTI